MDFAPIKTKKVYEEIIEQVKKMISEGTLSPGDKLISERELAIKLCVGRTAVREAIKALEAMGIVEVRQGEGTFVKGDNTHPFMEMLAQILANEQIVAVEVLELRKILELESARLAACRHTEEDLKRIEFCIEQMKKDILNEELGEQMDMSLHYAIADATHNSLLIKLMNTISDVMRKGLRMSREKLYQTPGSPDRLFKEHEEILKQIKSRNSKGAVKAMLKHLENVEKDMGYRE